MRDKRNVLSLLAPFLLGSLLYLGTLANEPVWDDVAFVFGQPFLLQCRNLLRVVDPRSLFWVLPVEGAARPAWLASVLLDACLWDRAVPLYRLVNLLWHSAGAVLLTGLAWALSRDRRVALAAGLVFAVHPLHTEPVNFIVDRSDLMAFAFLALSLLLYLRGRAAAGRGAMGAIAGSLLGYALGLLSKEPAVVLPGLVLLVDVLYPVPVPPRRRLAAYAALLLVTAAYLAFRAPRSGYVMEGHSDLFSRWSPKTAASSPPTSMGIPFPAKEVPDRPPWLAVYKDPKTRFLTMSAVLGGYLRQLLLPWPLQGDYSVAPIGTWSDARPWAAWAGWGAVLALAWRLRRRLPLASLGLLWTLVSLAPVSGVIALHNLRADRYAFIASAGACLALAAFLGEAFRRRPPGIITAACALALPYGALTWLRNADFKDDEIFFRSIVDRDPMVARARFNLGGALARRGRHDEAEAEFREAIRLWPEFVQGRILLARLLVEKGRTEEAFRLFDSTHRFAPDQPHLLHFNRGAALWAVGRPWEAYQYFRSALRMKPGFDRAALGAGMALLQLERGQEAIPFLRQALRGPSEDRSAALYHLALAYEKTGRRQEAERLRQELERALAGPVNMRTDLR